MQNLLDCLNNYIFIVGIFGILVGITGAIFAYFAIVHARRAERKSQEVLDHLIKEIRNFDEFAKRANEDFLVQETGTTMMSLISPAFAALSRNPRRFDDFETRLAKLMMDEINRKLQVIITNPPNLVTWYTSLIDAMRVTPDIKISIIEIIVKSLDMVKRRFIDLIEKGKCEIKTRDRTPQIFIRKDGFREEKYVAGMIGFLASDFHLQVQEMLGIKKPTYDEMIRLSKGIYSERQTFIEDQEDIFIHLWKEGASLNKREVESYFDEVTQKLEKAKNLWK